MSAQANGIDHIVVRFGEQHGFGRRGRKPRLVATMVFANRRIGCEGGPKRCASAAWAAAVRVRRCGTVSGEIMLGHRFAARGSVRPSIAANGYGPFRECIILLDLRNIS
ncbi:MAG: hypothetical protein R3E83_18255 [Burkholderiaceae bacterium]